MKKSKLFLLSLISLSLIGCTDTNSTTPATSTGGTPINQTTPAASTPTPSTPAPSTPAPSTPAPSTPTPSTPAPSTPAPSSEAPSTSSSANPYLSGWKRDTVDAMLKYLGGNILPYVSIGKTEFAEWKTATYSSLPYLYIEGSNEYNATMQTALTNAYTAAGWTITSSTTAKFEAALDSAGLKVLIKNDDSDWVTIKVDYDEPYDLTAETEWEQDLQDEMTDTFFNVLTYVYLGTANESYEFSSYSKQLTITGGKWNSQVLVDANATLTADGWIIDLTQTTGDVLVATKTDTTNVLDFTFKITKNGSPAHIEATITWKEGWNPGTTTAWPQDVLDEFDTYLDGHAIPYVYLGTSSPTTTYYSYSKELDIKGGAWDARVIPLAETAFAADTKADGSAFWTKTNNSVGTTFEVTGTFDDGCQLRVKLYKTYSDAILVEIYITKGFIAPTGGAWTQDTLDEINDNIGHTIPYVYLNTTAEDVSWDDAKKKLTISGSDYNAQVLTLADTAFAADPKVDANDTDWVMTSETASYSSNFTGTVHIFNKTFANGDKVKVTVGEEYYDHVCQMEIDLIQPFAVPAGATWTQDTLDAFNTYIGGHILPYIYLNTTSETPYWYSYSSYLEITGGLFVDDVLTNAQSVFTAENANITDDENKWTVTIDDSGYYSDRLTAEIKFDNSDKVKVTIDASYGGLAIMKVYFTEGFVVPTDPALLVWPADVQTSLTTEFGDFNYFPYVYLGTNTPTIAYNSTYECQRITGGAWDDRVVGLMDAAYNSAAGYVKMVGKDYYDNEAYFYYNAAHDILVALYNYYDTIYVNIYNNSGGTPVTITKDAAWPQNIQTFCTNNLNGYVPPVVDLGTTSTSLTTTSSSYDKTFSIVGGSSWQTATFIDAKTTFEAAGFTCEIGFNYYGLTVTAVKDENGNKITLVLKASYSGLSLVMKSESSFVVPTDPALACWGATVDAKLTSMTDTDENILPFIYLGCDNSALTLATYGSYEVDIKGGTWDDQIYTLAFNAFANANATITDDGQKWAYTIYQTSPTGTKYVHASRVFTTKSGATKRMTVSLYKNSYNMPLLETYTF